MEFGIIGTSIWQQNMPLLERLTINPETKEDTLNRLKSILELKELIYLSTCNRVEFIFVKSENISNAQILHRLIDFFFKGRKNISFFPNDFFQFSGKEAVTHLFRTTSSLESLVVGESQISGQFKNAFQEAKEFGLCGLSLETLAKEALVVSKKVKKETSIGQGCVSMASLAANELLDSLPGVKNPKVALVGSGEMSVKMAKYVKDLLKGEIVFVNRTLEKAEKLAKDHNGTAISLKSFKENPIAVDAIVSATACSEPIFGLEFLNLLKENHIPVVCIDLAIPRDFSFEFSGIQKVNLIDIPYLKAKVQDNLRKKFVEASQADEIVRDAVLKFLSNRIELSLKPIFNDSYKASIEFARKAFDDLLSHRMTSLPEEEKELMFELITKLVGHSSFQPVRMLSSHFVEMRSKFNFEDFSTDRKEAV